MKIYARERVRHLWFVDPVARTLEVFQLVLPKKTKRGRKASTWNLLGVWRDDARVRAEPFDAVELELGSLGRELDAPLGAVTGPLDLRVIERDGWFQRIAPSAQGRDPLA